MQAKITCFFYIESSHYINQIRFIGSTSIKLALPFRQENILSEPNTTITITATDTANKFTLEIISFSLEIELKQLQFIERVAEYLSFIISKKSDGYYGNHFIDIDWFSFKCETTSKTTNSTSKNNNNDFLIEDNIKISDQLITSVVRTIDFSNHNGQYHELLSYFFDGLRARQQKSKYFHWFLILEYLENTPKYKRLFRSEKLFSPEEKEIILQSTKSFENRKKNAISNLFIQTKKTRAEKLTFLIKDLGIIEINENTNKCISENIIKEIIEARNKMFHAGTDISEKTLYGYLFPITRMIVERISVNPDCLD